MDFLQQLTNINNKEKTIEELIKESFQKQSVFLKYFDLDTKEKDVKKPGAEEKVSFPA